MIKNLTDLDRAVTAIWDNYHMAIKDLEEKAAELDLNFDAVKRNMYENACYDIETVTNKAMAAGLPTEEIEKIMKEGIILWK